MKNVVRFFKALSIEPDTLELDPSRVHVWVVALHEPDTLEAATEAFLRPPVEMALVSPDPDGPATLSQGPQLALLRAKDLRIILSADTVHDEEFRRSCSEKRAEREDRAICDPESPMEVTRRRRDDQKESLRPLLRLPFSGLFCLISSWGISLSSSLMR